jgi:hypothetical protein
MQPNQRCLASQPKISSAADHCAARSFFESTDSSTIHVPATDHSPFFYTHGPPTLYAVDEQQTITFHCDRITKAGPDHALTITGRGNFSNPDGCTFQTDNIWYNPSMQHRVALSNEVITSKFRTNALIKDFPADNHQINIEVHEIASEMLPLVHTRQFSLYLIFGLSALSLTILFLLAVLYYKFRTVKATVLSFFSSYPADPPVHPP